MPHAPSGRIGDGDRKDSRVLDDVRPIRSSSGDYERRTGTSSTIDEAISTTILRDVKKVASKMKHVMMPHSNPAVELRDWDLWGPLILCMLLAISLCYNSPAEQVAMVFTSVFFIIWVGAGVITLNGLLLGGNISFFQSVCVLGYCVCPLNIASLLCHVFSSEGAFLVRLLIVVLALVWAMRASMGFMGQMVSQDKKGLGVFPILLFYISLAWMILVQ